MAACFGPCLCVSRAAALVLCALDHLGLVDRCHSDVHRLALEQRGSLHDAVILDPLGEPGQQVPADLGVGKLPAPELDGYLESISLLEELDGPADPRVEVPGCDLWLEPDFLEGHRALLALGFLLALGRFVLELTKVEKPDDRRGSHRCDLDEVVAAFLRHCESCGRGHDPKLAPVLIHHPDLWDPDHLVDAQVSTDGFTPSSVRSFCPRAAQAHSAPVRSPPEDSTAVQAGQSSEPGHAWVRTGMRASRRHAKYHDYS